MAALIHLAQIVCEHEASQWEWIWTERNQHKKKHQNYQSWFWLCILLFEFICGVTKYIYWNHLTFELHNIIVFFFLFCCLRLRQAVPSCICPIKQYDYCGILTTLHASQSFIFLSNCHATMQAVYNSNWHKVAASRRRARAHSGRFPFDIRAVVAV